MPSWPDPTMHAPGCGLGHFMPPAGMKPSLDPDGFRFNRVVPLKDINPDEGEDDICPPPPMKRNELLPTAGLEPNPNPDQFRFYEVRPGPPPPSTPMTFYGTGVMTPPVTNPGLARIADGCQHSRPRSTQSMPALHNTTVPPMPYNGYQQPPYPHDMMVMMQSNYAGAPYQKLQQPPPPLPPPPPPQQQQQQQHFSSKPCCGNDFWAKDTVMCPGHLPLDLTTMTNGQFYNNGGADMMRDGAVAPTPNTMRRAGGMDRVSAATSTTNNNYNNGRTKILDSGRMSHYVDYGCQHPYYPSNYACRPVFDRKYLDDCPEQDGPHPDTYTFL